MINTLNEIKKKIEYFADNHQNINQFECDEFSKFSVKSNKYPLMWATPRSAIFNEGQLVIPYTVMLIDIRYSESDLTQLMSDTLSTFVELLTYLSSESDNFSWFIKQNPTLTPVIDNLSDKVVGWQGDLNITLSVNQDEELIQWKV